MRTIQMQVSAGRTVTAQVPNFLTFMYSPQVVTVPGLDAGESVTVTVTNTATGESMSETKSYYRDAVQFELSRIVQILSGLEPLDALKRIDYSNTATKGMLQRFSFQIQATGAQYTATAYSWVLPGAMDGGETYGIGRKVMRLFVNYPQSANCWTDSSIPLTFNSFNRSYNASFNGIQDTDIQAADDICYNSKCSEVNVLRWLEAHRPSAAASLKNGKTITGYYGVSFEVAGGSSEQQDETNKQITLKPDLRTEGVYLRWLGRNGEAEYWLFTPGKKSVNVAVRNSYTHFSGDLAVPEGGVLGNSDFQDFSETRTITMGSNDVTLDEFERLCGLATSPVVEMLISNEPGNYLWQRVNVAGGSYERNIRRSTPGLQTFEITVNLPKRNTIQL